MPRKPRDLYRRVLDLVAHERLRHANRLRPPDRRSSPTDVEKAVGVGPDWFHRVTSGELRLSIDRVEDYLNATGTDPSLGMSMALENGEGAVLAALQRHAPSKPALRPAPRPAQATGAEPDAALVADLHRHLESADARRFTDIAKAFRAARRATRRVEREVFRQPSTETARLFCRATLVYGSTAYRANSPQLAAGCYYEGLDAAFAWKLDAERCDLHIRASSLLRDLFELSAATAGAVTAVELAVLIGDKRRLSEAFHQRGLAAHAAGMDEMALCLFELSGATFKDALPNSIAARAAVLQSAGRAEEAIALAELAERVLPSQFAAYPHWIRAEAFLLIGRFDEARAEALDAIAAFPDPRPEDHAFLLLVAAAASSSLSQQDRSVLLLQAAERELLPLAGAPLPDSLLRQLRSARRTTIGSTQQALALARKLRSGHQRA